MTVALQRGCMESGVGGVVIPSRHPQYPVGYEILARAVALYDRGHHVLGNIGIVGEELLGVFGQAVAAITERGIVVMRSDARIKPYSLDYRLRIKPFDFSICVKFVEIAYP